MKRHATPVYLSGFLRSCWPHYHLHAWLISATSGRLHLQWLEIFPKVCSIKAVKPLCDRELVYFSEQGRVHAITFFHADAMHLGGISLECQLWLFFSVCSHLLWWLELLTTLTDKHRIDLWGAGMQRAEQEQLEDFDLFSLYFRASCIVISSWHFHLKKQAPTPSLFWSTDNVKNDLRIHREQLQFSGNSFWSYLVSVCFSHR